MHTPAKGIEQFARAGDFRSWNVTSLQSERQCHTLLPFLKAWCNEGVTLLQETKMLLPVGHLKF